MFVFVCFILDIQLSFRQPRTGIINFQHYITVAHVTRYSDLSAFFFQHYAIIKSILDKGHQYVGGHLLHMQVFRYLNRIFQPVSRLFFLKQQILFRMFKLSGDVHEGTLFNVFILYIINERAQQFVCSGRVLYNCQIKQRCQHVQKFILVAAHFQLLYSLVLLYNLLGVTMVYRLYLFNTLF